MTFCDLFPLAVAGWAGFAACDLIRRAPELVNTETWGEFFAGMLGSMFAPISVVWESAMSLAMHTKE